MAMVNVADDMEPRARALRRVPQLLAADVLVRLGPVEHELGRAVGDAEAQSLGLAISDRTLSAKASLVAA